MASGHVSRIKRPNTWLHRPMLQNVKKALANSEPSTHGTKQTSRDVRLESVIEGKAEVGLRGPQVSSWTHNGHRRQLPPRPRASEKPPSGGFSFIAQGV